MLKAVATVLSTASFLMVSDISPYPIAAPPPVLELDHVYIVVAPGAVREVQALRQLGIIVDSTVVRHVGQGTASVAVFFENAYLELLWVDSSVTVDSLHRDDHADFVRAAAWRQSGASPFGVGLHFLSGALADLSMPVRLDSAARLTPGTYYVLLRQPEESLAADVFIVPADRPVTSWLGRYRSRRPDLFAHPMGARRLLHIVIRGPPNQRPRASELDTRLVGFEAAATPDLVLELDGGQGGQTSDLRPVLPLLFRR